METASTNANFALERDGRKAILTFTREDRLNALDAQTFRDLLVTLEAIEADREVGVVIVTGRGRAFVAGADVTGYSDCTVLEYVEFQRLGRLVYDRIERLRQPVIAAVNGYALGGGFELVLVAADFISAEEARALGIVNRVVPAEELMPAAHALADRILKRAPLAVEMAKQLVNDGLQASLPTAITQEMRMTATLSATADAREGIAAFIEKRPPEFTGH